MVRVTDANTLGGSGSYFHAFNYMTDAAAETNTWSVFDPSIGAHGGYRFSIIDNEGQVLPFILDAATMHVSRQAGRRGGYLYTYGSLPGGTFSFNNPDVFYGITGLELVSYDFATDATSAIYNFNACPRLPAYVSGYDGTLSNSGDDKKFAYYFGGSEQNESALTVYYNRAANGGAGACYWYNTVTGIVGGTNMANTAIVGIAARYHIHNARLSKDGTMIRLDSPASDGERVFVWKAGTNRVTECLNDCGGHLTLGYTHLINDPNNSDMADVLIRPLSNLWATTLLVNPLPWPRKWTDSHWSWDDANPSDTMPVCGSFYNSHGMGNGTQNVSTNPVLQITAPYDREVVCVSTSGPSKVWRFAHTRATGAANDNAWAGSSFWATPRGNVSQDGRFYMFTSDWEWSLGNPKGSWGCPWEGTCRTDVFVVELH